MPSEEKACLVQIEGGKLKSSGQLRILLAGPFIERKSTMNAGRLLTVMSTVVAVLCVFYGAQRVHAAVVNTDVVNTTGNIANDFHLRLQSTGQTINIGNTWEHGGNVVFNPAAIQGDGTHDVTLNWSGATANPGQTTHVGFSDVGNFDIKVTESWWTFGGLEVVPRPVIPSVQIGTGATNWTVVRVTSYSDSAGTNLTATTWWEEQGDFTSNISNITSLTYGFVSYATLVSPTMIPLEDINTSLGGFGSESSVFAIPEPSSFWLVMIALAALAKRRWTGPST